MKRRTKLIIANTFLAVCAIEILGLSAIQSNPIGGVLASCLALAMEKR